jgi:aldose 1-epimerase
MVDSRLKIIENESWQVGLLPEAGASIAFARINRDGIWYDFMRPTPEEHYGDAQQTASYLLVPWSNRIRDGLFSFRGTGYQLRINFPDGTAIHGAAKEFPWTIDGLEPNKVMATFNSVNFTDVNFPWKFSSRVDYRIDGPNFGITTWLKNEDKEPFPAGFGHHPYFLRTLNGADDTVEIEIPCSQYFVLENCMPSAGPVPIEPRVDFRQMRPLGEVFVDDCLTERDGEKPMRFRYTKSGAQIALFFDQLFQNVVLYIPQEKPFFALEPVTNANDGFNLMEKGIPGHSVFVLEPGEERSATFTFQVQA